MSVNKASKITHLRQPLLQKVLDEMCREIAAEKPKLNEFLKSIGKPPVT